MSYCVEPGQFPVLQKSGHGSSVLIPLRSPLKLSYLRTRRNFYYYQIRIYHPKRIEERFLAVEAFRQLIKSPVGDIQISICGEPFWVLYEKLEMCLVGTEDLVSLSSLSDGCSPPQ